MGFHADGTDWATNDSPIMVTKGTYYFVIMTLYSPDYSYDPTQNDENVY